MTKWSVAAESIWTQEYRTLSLVADRCRPPATVGRSPLGRSREEFAARLAGQSVKHIGCRTRHTKTTDRRSKNICPPHRRHRARTLCPSAVEQSIAVGQIYDGAARATRGHCDSEHVRGRLDWTRLDILQTGGMLVITQCTESSKQTKRYRHTTAVCSMRITSITGRCVWRESHEAVKT